MFAHPWNGSGVSFSSQNATKKDEENDNGSNSLTIRQAVQTIGDLNTTLTERTAHHLENLYDKPRRKGRRRRGRAAFDVALINKMIKTNDLKDEPVTKQ
eukprot:15334728-Ditylum_brightwellii.AAC.1